MCRTQRPWTPSTRTIFRTVEVHITWITSRHHPEPGGMALSSGRLVNSLKDRGHRVEVIHIAGSSHEEHHSRYFHSSTVAGFNAPVEPEGLFHAGRQRWEGSLLVGFGGGQAGYLAVLWAQWLSTRSLVLLRGNDFDRIIHDPRRGWMIHYILDHADLIGTVSQEIGRRAGLLRPHKPVIHTPNGIDPAEWTFFEGERHKALQWKAQRALPGRPIAGVFGQLKKKKGLETALEAFISCGLDQEAHLMTVGEVPQDMKDSLAAACPQAWIGVDFVDHRDLLLPVYYAAADVVFIPSLYDGMPNVLLEAMSLGIPVVASRAGGMPDVVCDRENGFLFEPGNAAQAASALRSAFALTVSERQSLILRARRTIEKGFTAGHEGDVLESALLGLEDGKGGRSGFQASDF